MHVERRIVGRFACPVPKLSRLCLGQWLWAKGVWTRQSPGQSVGDCTLSHLGWLEKRTATLWGRGEAFLGFAVAGQHHTRATLSILCGEMSTATKSGYVTYRAPHLLKLVASADKIVASTGDCLFGARDHDRDYGGRIKFRNPPWPMVCPSRGRNDGHASPQRFASPRRFTPSRLFSHQITREKTATAGTLKPQLLLFYGAYWASMAFFTASKSMDGMLSISSSSKPTRSTSKRFPKL